MCIVLYMHKVVDVWAGYGEGEACPDGMQRSWQFHHDAILKFEEVRFPGVSACDKLIVRSHEERRWLFEDQTQSLVSPSFLKYTRINCTTIYS